VSLKHLENTIALSGTD